MLDWIDQTDEILLLKLLKNLMLVLIERCHSALQFVVYAAAQLQTSQGAYADPCPLHKPPTVSARASWLDHRAMEDVGLV